MLCKRGRLICRSFIRVTQLINIFTQRYKLFCNIGKFLIMNFLFLLFLFHQILDLFFFILRNTLDIMYTVFLDIYTIINCPCHIATGRITTGLTIHFLAGSIRLIHGSKNLLHFMLRRLFNLNTFVCIFAYKIIDI